VLNNFYEAGEYKLQPDFVEQWFEFPVEDFILSGRIDRIDGAHVIDYKTGNYVPNIEELKNDVQTIVYLHGAHHIISKPAQSIIYYYLASNQKIQITKTPNEIKQDLEKIKDIVRKIRADKEFFPSLSMYLYLNILGHLRYVAIIVGENFEKFIFFFSSSILL